MPSSKGTVTVELRYWRTGAPWGGASAGMVKPESGCCEAARDELLSWPFMLRRGVPVRAGAAAAAGLGAFEVAIALVVVVVVVAGAGL